MLRGIITQKSHAPLAQVASGDVGNASEGEVVAVSDHPQIGQRILDLGPTEEGDAAVNGIGNPAFSEDIFKAPRDIMCTVEYSHAAERNSPVVQFVDLEGNPFGFGLGVVGMMVHHGISCGQRGDQVLFDAVFILIDEGIGNRQNLRRRTVVLHHQDGSGSRKLSVEIQQILHIGPAPGIDSLVGVTDYKQVFVITAENLHQLILKEVYILKLIDHDVFQTLLPLQADFGLLPEDMEREFDQVVIVQAETFLFLIQVAVENNIVDRRGLPVFFVQRIEGHADQVLIILGLSEKLLDLDHVPGLGKCFVPEGKLPLLIDDLKDVIDV